MEYDDGMCCYTYCGDDDCICPLKNRYKNNNNVTNLTKYRKAKMAGKRVFYSIVKLIEKNPN